VTKERYYKFIEDVPLVDIKKVCKQYKTSFNVVVPALISQTLAEYFHNNGDTKTKEINFVSTFSLKPFPRSKEEFTMGNFAAMQLYKFPLRTDFKEAVLRVKDCAKELVGGPFLIAFR
jgi:hypothetical protein